MSKSIPLSPKHGLNPTIPLCAWCGKEKNEIALLGKIPHSNDAEAPRRCILDYQPCDECRKKWDTGVVIIEVTTHPNVGGQMPISPKQSAYPTGRYSVVNPACLNEPEKYPIGKPVLMTSEDYQKTFCQE